MILKNILQNFHNSKGRTITVVLICSLLFLQACSKKNDVREVEVTKKTDLEMYLDAKRTLDAGVWQGAIQRYKALRSHYPFGHYTEQGYLELAYAQYKVYKMEEAVVTVDRFIKNYPAHKNLDYAYYLKGLIYFESDRGFLERANPSEVADHNQENIRNAFTAFKNFIERYPESNYAADAHKRMVFLKNQLAAYEIHVAKYYLRRSAPIAALNRCKFVLESFQDTPATANALALMVEAYIMMDEAELAEQSKLQLMTDFPNHSYLQTGKLELKTELFNWTDLWPF